MAAGDSRTAQGPASRLREPNREPPVASVVVCAYEARDQIDTALCSLRAQDFQEPYEVIVVASGADGTEAYVRRRYPEVRVVAAPERLYPGPARNRGVAAARGTYIAFLPADGHAHRDWLRRRVTRHRDGFQAVGGAIGNGTPWHPVGSAGYYLEYAPLVSSERVLAQHAVPHCLSYERAVLVRLGGYPEDVETGEDTLFNVRCLEQGIRIGFEPRAVLDHENPRGVGAFLRHQYDHGRGLAICVERHGLAAPIGPSSQSAAKALWRTFADYPFRRWRYDLECLARGKPRLLPGFLALTPIVAAGLWATSLGAWSEWRSHSVGAGQPGQGLRVTALARAAHRVILCTGRGPLRLIWSRAYDAVARGVAAHLRRPSPDCALYVRGGMGERDVVPGLSDIDMVAVAPQRPGQPDAERRALKERWLSLRRLFPALDSLVDVSVYEDEDLADSVASPTTVYSLRDGEGDLETGRAAYFGPSAHPDDGGLRERPGIGEPMRDWRLVAGPERRGPSPPVDRQRQRIAAWLEIQRCWAYASPACAHPGPRAAYLCLKSVAEPLRAWLWLTRGELFGTRTEALQRALVCLPEEGAAIEMALELRRRLHRAPDPPFAVALPALLRLTSRIADLIATEAGTEEISDVRLNWSADEELALEADSGRGLGSLGWIGTPARALPLVDWRALVVVPAIPDESLAPVPGDPADPSTLAACAVAGERGTYPALLAGGVMVLPADDVWRRGLLRAVQSPLTDPVSFALLRGEPNARFVELPGWSIGDVARRAVAEHRGWLASPPSQRPESLQALAMLFTAARAGLLLESLTERAPELSLTVAGTARRLAERLPGRRSAIEAAHEAFSAARPREEAPAVAAVAALREAVLELPPYRLLPQPALTA